MSDFEEGLFEREMAKIKDLPREEANIGIAVEGKDVGVKGSVAKDIGKPGGWELEAQGSWMQRAGAKLAALLSWKGK
jgi:hypothetical protein